MAGLSFIWTLRYRGWAVCTISDDHGQAEAIASDTGGVPSTLSARGQVGHRRRTVPRLI